MSDEKQNIDTSPEAVKARAEETIKENPELMDKLAGGPGQDSAELPPELRDRPQDAAPDTVLHNQSRTTIEQQVSGERTDPAADDTTVNLPALISDEFGMSRPIAQQQIELGMVLVNDEPLEGNRIDVPREQLIGKEITVMGRDRSFRMVYDPESRREFPGAR